MKPIENFTGPYSFLSNAYPCKVTFYTMVFPSVEAALQASRCANAEDRKQFTTVTAAEAERLGKQIKVREDWDERKMTIMNNLIVHKFAENPELVPKLLDTGVAYLRSSNTEHENYWGCCVCPKCGGTVGKNKLGWLLMRTRAILIADAFGVWRKE